MLPSHGIARLGIARTFQNLRLFARLTVLENVLCGLTAQGGRSIVAALFRITSYNVCYTKLLRGRLDVRIASRT